MSGISYKENKHDKLLLKEFDITKKTKNKSKKFNNNVIKLEKKIQGNNSIEGYKKKIYVQNYKFKHRWKFKKTFGLGYNKTELKKRQKKKEKKKKIKLLLKKIRKAHKLRKQKKENNKKKIKKLLKKTKNFKQRLLKRLIKLKRTLHKKKILYIYRLIFKKIRSIIYYNNFQSLFFFNICRLHSYSLKLKFLMENHDTSKYKINFTSNVLYRFWNLNIIRKLILNKNLMKVNKKNKYKMVYKKYKKTKKSSIFNFYHLFNLRRVLQMIRFSRSFLSKKSFVKFKKKKLTKIELGFFYSLKDRVFYIFKDNFYFYYKFLIIYLLKYYYE